METIFHTGGALKANDGCAVERKADGTLALTLVLPKYLYVKGPRQTGKTSLFNRLRAGLAAKGWKCALVDLSAMKGIDKGRWFQVLGNELVRQFCCGAGSQLADQIDLKNFLLDHAGLQDSARLAIFFDEIEGLIEYPFSDEFLMTLRYLYNVRDDYNGSLTVAAAGVVASSTLVKDPATSPFNLVEDLVLDDFTKEESRQLTRHLDNLAVPIDEPVHERIYHWADGQPHLTTRICEILEGLVGSALIHRVTVKEVDGAVRERLLDPVNWDSNVKHIRGKVAELAEPAATLWQRLLSGDKVTPQELGFVALDLTGAVKLTLDQRVTLRNRIYQEAVRLPARQPKPVSPIMMYDRAAVRELVKSAITESEFRNLCFNHFHAVYEQFTTGQTRDDRILLLVEHADKHLQLDVLLHDIKKINSKAFARFGQLLEREPRVLAGHSGDHHNLPSPTIGVITALTHEYVAVKVLLENGIAHTVPGKGAGREYWLAEVSSIRGGRHPVALCLADMGNNSAAIRATRLLEHFPGIESVLIVGIAGGIPHPTKVADHVRLGDVVVSDKRGVIQYDFIKKYKTVKEIRFVPRPPGPRLLEAVQLLEAGRKEGQHPWLPAIEQALRQLGWVRPPPRTDRLVATVNPSRRLRHPRRTPGPGQPRVFIGPIASANILLKDPSLRDSLRDKFNVKAVEMEASGIADAAWTHERGYLVVRGVCDYCDTTKGDAWQHYAAVVAAAYTHALVKSMAVEM